tara:strand:+ start:285 stop:878 length:594 start_codon:yes stop_codon:yes gene_type:complete
MNIIDNDFFGDHASKFGFLFVTFMIVTGGFVKHVIPCQTQVWLQHSSYGKHVIGWLICFLFIMLEGGWSFDMETQNKALVNWTNGNVLDSLIFGFGLYVLFLFTAKTTLIYNGALMFLLLLVYGINTQRLYWYKRDLITKEKNYQLIEVTKYIFYLSVLLFIYGIHKYIAKKKKEYKNSFSYLKFFFASDNCHSVKS